MRTLLTMLLALAFCAPLFAQEAEKPPEPPKEEKGEDVKEPQKREMSEEGKTLFADVERVFKKYYATVLAKVKANEPYKADDVWNEAVKEAKNALNALTQLLEAFVGRKANALTDGFCREGLSRAARSLERAWADGGDMAARTDMSLAALLGGMALANAGLGAVHGFAGPLGGMIDAPHGVICARLLPHVVAANVAALRQRGPAAAIERFNELARLLTGCQEARAQDAVAWIRSLCDRLQVPALRSFGLRLELIPEAVAKAQKASSMKGNPVELTDSELTAILQAAL